MNASEKLNGYVLRREIPMAWGTTTDSLTPEIISNMQQKLNI